MKFYSEYLARIGVVSVTIQSEEKVSLVSNELIRCGDNDVPLPCPVNQILDVVKKDGMVTIRLKTGTHSQPFTDTTVKWDRKRLSQGFSLKCICGNTIADSSTITRLNDMPSEYWAEMMEFWHCHKPHDHNGHVHVSYETNLKPKENGVLLGEYFMLFNPNEVSHLCAKCGASLGEVSKDGLTKIYNWSIKLNDETFQPFEHARSVIWNHINSAATRILQFTDSETESENFVVWIFGVGVDFTATNTGVQTNALKVYYTKEYTTAREERGDIEIVNLPKVVLDDMIRVLEKTNDSLPCSLRSIKYWELGFI